jgi:peptidoglycan/xylan/chitin deacetylase (PgdA/CDA1 family)
VFLSRLISVSATCAIILAASAASIRAESSPAKAAGPLAGIQLAITVDDIPENGDTLKAQSRDSIARSIIRALKTNGAAGVYGFANGYGLSETPGEIAILKEWLRAGNPLGNHTYDHSSLDQVEAPAFEANIAQLDVLLESLSSVSPLIAGRRVFRYPYLEEGNTLVKRDAVRGYLATNGYRIAEVTTDYNDWAWNGAYIRCTRLNDKQSIEWLRRHIIINAESSVRSASELAQKLFGRNVAQILLIHDCALEALLLNKTLAKLRADGLTFISLDEALRDPAYKINPNVTTEGGQSFFKQIAESRAVDTDAFVDTTYTVERLNAVCAQNTAKTPPPQQ